MHDLKSADRASRKSANEREPLRLSFEFFPPKTDAMEQRFHGSAHQFGSSLDVTRMLRMLGASSPASHATPG